MARWDRGNNPPDDWDEQADGWHTMIMCVPASHQWRTVVLSAIWLTTSARYYTWSDGRAMAAKDIAERMIKTMTFDCNNDLARIADALESLDAKTPEIIDLREIIDSPSTFFGPGVLAWVSPLLEIMGSISAFLPEWRISKADVAKLFLDSLFKAKILAALLAIATAQTAIAGATTGVAIGSLFSGGMAYLNKLTDVFSGLRDEVLSGVGWIWDTYLGPGAEEQATSAEQLAAERNLRLAEQNVILTAAADGVLAIHQTLQDCVCGGVSSGTCCCGAVPGQPIFDGDEQLPDSPCVTVPDGFDDYADWMAYSRKFACWVGGKYVLMASNIGNLEGALLDLIGQALSEGTYSVTELYNRVVSLETQIIPLTVYYNVPETQRAAHRAALTDHLARMLDQIAIAGDEAGKDAAIAAYLSDPTAALIAEMGAQLQGGEYQVLADEYETLQIRYAIENWIDEAFVAAIDGVHSVFEPMQLWFGATITNNLANIHLAKLPEVVDMTDTCFDFIDPCEEGEPPPQ